MNCCRFLNKRLDSGIDYIANFVDSNHGQDSLRKTATITGKVCLLVFIIMFSVVGYAAYFVLLPYEYKHSTSVIFAIRFFLATWSYYSVFFHYYKSRTLEPVKNPGKPNDSFCMRCNNWKGPRTFHCKGCDRCIFRMDHHCPHIGQCVGAHNQAHFFLFLFNLWIGTYLGFLLAPNFWLSLLGDAMETPVNCKDAGFSSPLGCVVRMIADVSKKRVEHGVIVNLAPVIFLVLNILMMSFLGFYCFLISSGETMMERAYQMTDSNKIGKKWTCLLVRRRWREYFLVRNSESFLRVLFVPWPRDIVKYDDASEM